MTWQRIDEDTYIDNSLVTCAEYQLFVDEMLEQGKYYQPDHWISYQFSKNHATEPIFGVRFLDALEFCNWLTERDDQRRSFRLLTINEFRQFPLKRISNKPWGYWVFLGKGKYGYLALHEKYSSNKRGLNLSNALERDIQLARSFEKIMKRFQNRKIPLSIAFDEAFSLDRELDLGRFGSILPRNLEIDRNDAIAAALDKARDLVLERAFTLDLKLYADLFTLQERIAGRSPAFEGIRLVKERIK